MLLLVRYIENLKRYYKAITLVLSEITVKYTSSKSASTETGRKFVELQGWANQYVAAMAQQVVFMISGIPLQVKPSLAG